MPNRLLLLISVVAASCSSYKQNIMFKPGEGFKADTKALETAEKNYVIQVNDYLKLDVYSNKGERIIDPNGELYSTTNGNGSQNQSTRIPPSYLVTVDGLVKFPMIEPVSIVGMTIREAEIRLQSEYNRYYKECYVILTFSNKRVIVLGAPGGQVIPLINENVSVVEVLAMAKGLGNGNDGKSSNIRLIRGNNAYVLDLSTIEGIKQGNMIVQPGDIIYVEPTRRPFAEGARDLAPVLSLVISLATLVVVFLANN
jgi:polysaccharide export outer membrane protein